MWPSAHWLATRHFLTDHRWEWRFYRRVRAATSMDHGPWTTVQRFQNDHSQASLPFCSPVWTLWKDSSRKLDLSIPLGEGFTVSPLWVICMVNQELVTVTGWLSHHRLLKFYIEWGSVRQQIFIEHLLFSRNWSKCWSLGSAQGRTTPYRCPHSGYMSRTWFSLPQGCLAALLHVAEP